MAKQLRVSDAAHKRLKIKAAKEEKKMIDILNDLIMGCPID